MDEPDIDEPDTDEPVIDEPVIALDHPRFRYAWVSLFTRRFAPNCMTHDCEMLPTQTKKHDICCQYGCDIDIRERDEILARADKIRPLLHPDAQNQPWFDEDVEEDEDYPSGEVVRSAVWNDACIFTAHDKRGCAIHRAAIEQGWNVRDIKPAICRLFPLSYEEDTICLADEYMEYSCAFVEGPTLYRLTRDTLGDVFGEDLVRAMDAAEATVLASQPKKLPIAP